MPASGWSRRLLGPLFWLPAGYAARIALDFDRLVAEQGISEAFGRLLARFVREVQVRGADAIPPGGPLLVAANHPGALEVPLISAALHRDDLKIVISTVPELDELPHVASHLIQVTREPRDGLRGVRQAVRHLQAGGALLILPSGIVDPDPDLLPSAHEALESWSPSLEIMLRQVPDAQVVVAIASGVLSPTWLHSPLTKLQREIWRQRKLAEFLQIIQQLVLPGSLLLSPRLSFAPPVAPGDLAGDGTPHAMQRQLVLRAQRLLAEHMAAR